MPITSKSLPNPSKPRILLIDIETSPLICYSWSLYPENGVIKRIKSFTILSVAYQWLGKKTQVIACDNRTEKQLLRKLHDLLNKADIVVAHNGNSFDIKKINNRLIVYDFSPPSPYKKIDTKKEAKNIAAFDSNSLNNLGIDLDEGEKIKHRGFDMWEGCMAGIEKDWREMKRYNKKDVDLLQRIYLRLRPWMKNHPNLSAYQRKSCCDKCGSTKLHSRGKAISGNYERMRYQCQSCGGWTSDIIGKRTAHTKAA